MIVVESVVEDRFEQAAAFGLGGGEMRSHLVTKRHQFINLDDNALLRHRPTSAFRQLLLALCERLR